MPLIFDFHQPALDPDGDYDDERVPGYVVGLMAAFNNSAEAQLLRDRQNWARPMMEFGFSYVGVSPADMTAGDFEEVLFELFPRKISTEADQAESIITELRAFWSFLSRQYAAANSPEILALLDDDAVVRLRTELSNPANFGLAKSMFMLGSQSGFNMTSPDGLQAFQMAYNAKLQAGQIGPFPLEGVGAERNPRQTNESSKKKRKDKKRQREAKKRNRRGC